MLSIAALKKVSKGTRILLLDRNGGQSKVIAKALSKRGFKKVLQSLPGAVPLPVRLLCQISDQSLESLK